MSKPKTLLILTFVLAIVALLAGCSNNNPTGGEPDQVNGYPDGYSPLYYAGVDEATIYDVAFRDTIVDIDYDNATFNVASRSETITTDENTFIWLQIVNTASSDSKVDIDNSTFGSAKGQPQNYIYTRDSVLEFSDLQVGYVVEVRASIFDASTLLAGKIKVASCNYQEVCFEFADVLASVDVDLLMVTFVTEPRIGTVCQKTVLIGTDGETLTLADFDPGDNVYVRGRIIADDTLKVCAMTKTE